jgi:Ku protein, prokaryotic
MNRELGAGVSEPTLPVRLESDRNRSSRSWPRANWKGFLRLSLVTCPVALYPATSDSEKISFNQINRNTGHRIKYARVDAETGEEVANEDIMKGYKVDTDTYIEVTKEELENVALESTRTIEIDEFVQRDEIDPRYIIRPYYLRPDGKVGHDAFAVIRETIREMNKVAIGRVVLTNREHIIALEPLDKGLMGTLLRYLTKCAPRTNISTTSRTSKSPRTCSISPSTSSTRRRAASSRTNSRTSTKQRWSTSRSAPASRSRTRTVPLEAMSWT